MGPKFNQLDPRNFESSGFDSGKSFKSSMTSMEQFNPGMLDNTDTFGGLKQQQQFAPQFLNQRPFDQSNNFGKSNFQNSFAPQQNFQQAPK